MKLKKCIICMLTITAMLATALLTTGCSQKTPAKEACYTDSEVFLFISGNKIVMTDEQGEPVRSGTFELISENETVPDATGPVNKVEVTFNKKYTDEPLPVSQEMSDYYDNNKLTSYYSETEFLLPWATDPEAFWPFKKADDHPELHINKN